MNQQRLTEAELITLLEDDAVPDEQVEQYFEFDETTLPAGLEGLALEAIEDTPNLSTADRGIMGHFNRRRRRKRHRQFVERAQGFEGLTIVCEGDSWFHYPVILDDVVEHLFDDAGINIYSMAFAGDWLANMWHQKDYLKALDDLRPEVFLISGGGNDLVGKRRLQFVLRSFQPGKPASWYLEGSFERVLKEQEELYAALFDELTERFPKMKIFGHGYDHPIPDGGKWLGEPMKLLGIGDRALQREIARTMIDRYNEMYRELADRYPQVTYIDCRGVVRDWSDELHPTSASFGLVAERFKAAIANARKEVLETTLVI